MAPVTTSLQGYQFDKIFPGCRIIDIHEYLLEKGITLPAGQAGYLYHEPCHNPMKLGDSDEDREKPDWRQRG